MHIRDSKEGEKVENRTHCEPHHGWPFKGVSVLVSYNMYHLCSKEKA
jgi:hypothetical protein